jgi:glycosyltransferase involved in cell wall biosynthesis
MASGLPLTVSDIAEFAEVVDERWAIALPVGRPEGWARAWDALYADPASRMRMGVAARGGSDAFSVARVGEETLTLYRELLNPRGESEEAAS